jgi:RNA polymerase sigma-70 factor (ECF subfamily)
MTSVEPTINPSKWVSLYSDYLFNYAITRIQNKDSALDLVQETFLAALKSKDNFRGESTEKTWLTSILKRKIIDLYRKKASKKEDNETYDKLQATGFESPFSEGDIGDRAWSPNSRPNDWHDENFSIESEEFQKILENCMSRLPDKWAACFSLKVIEEEITESVCKELDITPSNLWVILHRARLQLRECMEKQWFK